jgi:hypothetical protein
MASALERWLPEPVDEAAAQPKYLNTAAMDSPDSANAAVRREVWHLFDQAFVILAHGIHLHREQISDSDDLKATINSDRERIDIDMDLVYQQRVKSLYNAILDFISGRMTRVSSPSSTDELYRLQHAASEMVEAIKHVKHLRKNLSTYMVSNNAAIRREYNDLRLRVAMVLRETYRFYQGGFDDASTAILELDEIAVRARVDREAMVARVTRTPRGEEDQFSNGHFPAQRFRLCQRDRGCDTRRHAGAPDCHQRRSSANDRGTVGKR